MFVYGAYEMKKCLITYTINQRMDYDNIFVKGEYKCRFLF